MKKTIFFIAMAVLCLFFRATAQVSVKPKAGGRPLVIGDRVPDLVFQNVINYSAPMLRFSDFKGGNTA